MAIIGLYYSITKTTRYSEQVLIAAVENCALSAEFNYNCLSSPRMCEDNPEAWERRLDEAVQWAALSNAWLDDLHRLNPLTFSR